MSRYEITSEQREEIARTGELTLTPEQRELDFAENFTRHAFDYGLQFYGAARFSFAAGFMTVAPTALHHAVEVFLQGSLAVRDTPAAIRRYPKIYRNHKLPPIWDALKAKYPGEGLEEFDAAVAALEKFHPLRFPENLAEGGGSISTGFADVAGISGRSSNPEREYYLSVAPFDRLVVKLFAFANLNPAAFDWRLKNKHAEPYFAMQNASPLR